MITIESAQIMKLLGMGSAELDIPIRYSMFDDISKYFADPKTAPHTILKILGKNVGKDNLEVVWRYVKLQNEKMDMIKKLNPEDFEGYIAEEIKHGALSLDSQNKIEADPNLPKFSQIKEILNSVKDINQAIESYG